MATSPTRVLVKFRNQLAKAEIDAISAAESLKETALLPAEAKKVGEQILAHAEQLIESTGKILDAIQARATRDSIFDLEVTAEEEEKPKKRRGRRTKAEALFEEEEEEEEKPKKEKKVA